MTHFHSFHAPPLRHNIDMAAIPSEDSRLSRLTRICLALPEAARRACGSHAAFLVRKRTFAYFLNGHHGDGIVSVACKALPGGNAAPRPLSQRAFTCPPTSGRGAGSRCVSTWARSIGMKSPSSSWAAIAWSRLRAWSNCQAP